MKNAARRTVASAILLLALTRAVDSQIISLATPWSAYAHDPQHTALSPTSAQPLQQIRWQTPVDLHPQYSGDSLLIHYGSPLVTRANTVIVPVKTGNADGFQIEGRRGVDGALLWTAPTDYSLPPHDWLPPCGIALTFRNQLLIPGAGGTLYFLNNPDSPGATVSGQIAFYGTANYQADRATYDSAVFINTPLTTDRYGNVFFGFQVTGNTPLGLKSGIARISAAGVGTFVSAATAAGDGAMLKVAHNCAPALSNDQRTLYIAVSNGSGAGFARGYLLALDSRTLTRTARVRLKDPGTPANDAYLPEAGTATPTVGPDGDVYFGVLENPFPAHNYRGWLLHFSANLVAKGYPGGFGWDDSASIVPASMVPSYRGRSRYLLMTKYNNYATSIGDGVNKIAILDPNASQPDAYFPVLVMKEVLTVAGPTPDEDHIATHPNAVREWCINTAAVDPARGSVFANCEDGKLYRWDLVTNTLAETFTLTSGIGEAYTPTLIGVDGTVYAINNATLFAVGR